tara:strand:- start:78 stop:314 length:237 start_codon:yes stop_codon:yes gene_type:complete
MNTTTNLPYLPTEIWDKIYDVKEAMEQEEEIVRWLLFEEKQDCINALWEQVEDDYIAWGEPGHEESYQEFLDDYDHVF